MTNYSLKFLYSRIKKQTLTKQQAQSKVCQEIFIAKIGSSDVLTSKTVFKGGLIIDALSNGQRGYTKDIDFDLIKHPLSIDGLLSFIDELNKSSAFSNVKIAIDRIEELRHQNYHGRRLFLSFNDGFDIYNLTIDIGVYIPLVLKNTFLKYDVAFGGNAKIQVNPIERMIFEKISTFVIYGADNSRDKDYFDVYYLITNFNYSTKLIIRMIRKELIIKKHYYNSIKETIESIKKVILNNDYKSFLKKSTRNWINEDIESTNETFLRFLNQIIKDSVEK